MIIGVPSEVKNNEFRVGLTPNSVQIIVSEGHSVYIPVSYTHLTLPTT